MNSLKPFDFVQALRETLKAGCRIIPFVGAGLSRPAGIPVAAELKRYLAYCTWRALAHSLSAPDFPSLWNPRMHPWPRMSEMRSHGQSGSPPPDPESVLCEASRKA